MKSSQSLGFSETNHPSDTQFFEQFSAKLLEERSERRRKIVYGCLIVICVLLIARLLIG